MGGCSDADNILSSIESVEVDTAPAPSANTPLMDFSGGGILSPASACDPDPQGGVGGKVLSLSCIEDPSDPVVRSVTPPIIVRPSWLGWE